MRNREFLCRKARRYPIVRTCPPGLTSCRQDSLFDIRPAHGFPADDKSESPEGDQHASGADPQRPDRLGFERSAQPFQGRKTLGRKSRRAEIKGVNVMISALPDVEGFHEVSRAGGPRRQKGAPSTDSVKYIGMETAQS